MCVCFNNKKDMSDVYYSIQLYTLRKKGAQAVTGAVPLYTFPPKECILVPQRYILGYLLKGHNPGDSFCTFLSESVSISSSASARAFISKSHKMLSCFRMSDIILWRGVLQVALIKTRSLYWSSLLGDRSHLEPTPGDQSAQNTPIYTPPLSGSLGLQ